jgi:hypothetical protein
MKKLIAIYSRICIRQFKSVSLYIIILTCIIASCTTRKTPYSIIEFKSEGAVFNFSKSLYWFSQESDSLNPAKLIAGTGDIISPGDDDLLIYRDPSQSSFTFKSINGVNYVNNKINSIDIPKNLDMISWFKEIKNIDISTMEFIKINSNINDSYLPYLKEIAKSRPDLGLVCNSELSEMKMILDIFNPRFIFGAEISSKDFIQIGSLSNLELLSGVFKDSGNTIPLPALPHLKQIILTEIEKETKLDDLLINNRQIERVTLWKSGIFDFSIIKPLTSLKELVVIGFDSTANSDLLRNQKQLEVLSLLGEKVRINSSPGELADLRWITFSPATTQSEFNTFIETHPDLEVVEIANNKLITGLQPLLNLKKVIGLTISDTLTDVVTIKSLKNIKYLSLPEKLLKDSLLKADLKRSLPNTTIVANHGFCLGSGWLLLLIPFVLLFRSLSRRISG